jgi:hypothetical protein
MNCHIDLDEARVDTSCSVILELSLKELINSIKSNIQKKLDS